MKIQRGIFQGDALLPFVVAMMPNHILRKCTSGYRHRKSHGRYKTVSQKEKEMETLIQVVRICSQDIGMKFDIEKCAMLIMKNKKRHRTEGIELLNQN